MIARVNNTAAFIAITASVKLLISKKLSETTAKLIPAPTVIKNNPSNSPLKGSMLLSSS